LRQQSLESVLLIIAPFNLFWPLKAGTKEGKTPVRIGLAIAGTERQYRASYERKGFVA
jgi:hypothetical protein